MGTLPRPGRKHQRDGSHASVSGFHRRLVFLTIFAILLTAVAGPVVAVSTTTFSPSAAPSPFLPLQAEDGEDDSSGPQIGEDELPVGGSDTTDSGDTGDGDRDGDSNRDSDDPDRPPEGVTAGEYYDENQIETWQSQADDELGLNMDVSEMDATAAYDAFVEGDEDGASADVDGGAAVSEDGTAQIGGGVGPSFDPAENLNEILLHLEELMTDGMIFLIDEVFNQAFGTPHPENDGWRGILGEPTGETYQELRDYQTEKIMPPLFMLMMLAFLAYVFIAIPWAGLNGKRVLPSLVAMFGIAGFVLLGWNVATLLQSVSHEVTMWFLPAGEDIVDTTALETGDALAGDDEEVKLGLLGALLGIKFAGWNAGLVLAFMHGFRALILVNAPVFMGVLLAAMYFGHRVNKIAASVLFWQYIGLLLMNWPTAILLSLAQEVNYTFGLQGSGGEFLNVVMTIGLFIVAILLPLALQATLFGGSLAATFLKGSVLQSVTSAGRRYLPSASGATRRLRQGGGYINPTDRFTRTKSNARTYDSRQRSLARGYGTGAGSTINPRSKTPQTRQSRSVTTDGGYARLRRTRSRRTSSISSSRSGSAPSRSRHDAGSVDARRRERYRRLRKED